MPQIHALVALAFLLSLVLASPIRQERKRSFKVRGIPNPNYKPDGPRAYRRALSKFGFDDIGFVPGGDVASRVAAASKASSNSTTSNENGETPATGAENDALFVAPVTIGGQQLLLNFDTGSADFWVFNTNLDADAQTGHTIYDPSQSTTAQDLDGTFEITYGDGSFASGPVALDTVDIGGSTVDAQAIGLPNNVSQSFIRETASNGLVGLAFSTLNTIQPTQQKTFFENVVNDLTQPVFTASLKHDAVGSYEFGIIDTSSFTGSLAVTPIDSSNGFWQFASESAVIAGQTVSVPGGVAIADTGTSLILTDDNIVVAYWSQVQDAQISQEAGGVVFPCDTVLPDLQLAIGDQLATVNGENVNFSQVGTDNTGREFCFGGIQSNQGIGFSILGDVFFKSNFVVFDLSGPSLAFAPHSS
ncbi:hypothetical protein DV738_g4244, partial [Chaetothyriales sp. CBS 135597]